MIHWLIENWIEITGVITGLAYIFLSIKQNIWCWLFGIISSALYLYVFFHSKIYADMVLQIYYVAVGIYGWVHWANLESENETDNQTVLRLNAKEWLTTAGITAILFVVIAEFLIHFTDSPVPWIDAFTTALSVTATWMLARKILEHWLIWVLVDAVSIGLFFYRGLYVSILLFGVLTVMAVIGYFEWKREWNKKQALLILS